MLQIKKATSIKKRNLNIYCQKRQDNIKLQELTINII
jgi:hypothetical protein